MSAPDLHLCPLQELPQFDERFSLLLRDKKSVGTSCKVLGSDGVVNSINLEAQAGPPICDLVRFRLG